MRTLILAKNRNQFYRYLMKKKYQSLTWNDSDGWHKIMRLTDIHQLHGRVGDTIIILPTTEKYHVRKEPNFGMFIQSGNFKVIYEDDEI